MAISRRSVVRLLIVCVLSTTGAITVASVVPGAGAPAPTPIMRVDFLGFPASPPPPVDRREVRQAIAYALDRPSIAAVMPTAVPAVGVNHPRHPGYDPQVRGFPYDPARAKSLLTGNWSAESVLKIYTSTSAGYRGTAWDAVRAKIAENLMAVGIRSEYVPVPFNTIVDLIQAGVVSYIVGWAVLPTEVGYPYFSVSIAYEMKFREGADVLVSRFQQTNDPREREMIAKELEQWLLDHAFIIPLFFRG